MDTYIKMFQMIQEIKNLLNTTNKDIQVSTQELIRSHLTIAQSEIATMLAELCKYDAEIGEINAEEACLLRQIPCEKIKAIKSYRSRTGCGLKEAKDAVELWMDKNGIPRYTN